VLLAYKKMITSLVRFNQEGSIKTSCISGP